MFGLQSSLLCTIALSLLCAQKSSGAVTEKNIKTTDAANLVTTAPELPISPALEELEKKLYSTIPIYEELNETITFLERQLSIRVTDGWDFPLRVELGQYLLIIQEAAEHMYNSKRATADEAIVYTFADAMKKYRDPYRPKIQSVHDEAAPLGKEMDKLRSMIDNGLLNHYQNQTMHGLPTIEDYEIEYIYRLIEINNHVAEAVQFFKQNVQDRFKKKLDRQGAGRYVINRLGETAQMVQFLHDYRILTRNF